MNNTRNTPLQGVRVLVVEDNFVLADSLCWALEGFGAEVIGPEPSCERALAQVATGRIDVAILDIDLQGVSSAPVALALREAGRPFLFLTGFENADALPAGVQDVRFLRKPVDPYDVAMAVQELLRPSGGDSEGDSPGGNS